MSLTFDSYSKDYQRLAVTTMYASTRKPLVYLDGPDAGATTHFLDHKIPPKHLLPVNYNAADAQSISKISKVKCAVMSIDEYIFTLADDSAGAVWLDYTRATFSEEVLRKCLAVAPFVMVVLSTRNHKTRVQDTVQVIKDAARKHGELLESPAAYKGKSGYTNMLKFILGRKPCHAPEKAEPKPAEVTPAAQKKDPEPLSYTTGDRVHVWWRNEWTTGEVTGHAGDKTRVLMNCNGRERAMDKSNLRPNIKTVSEKRVAALVGKTICIPPSLWSSLEGYEDVQRKGNKLVYRIVRYYKKKYTHKFAVTGISKKTGLPLKEEKWYLHYDAAMCYRA